MNIAVCGYGNLGRGVECAVLCQPDMKLTGIYTRRDPEGVKTLTGVPVYHVNELDKHRNDIDVLILCGGSATDLPEMTPAYAERFNVVDSFDNHAKIPDHFARVNEAASGTGHTALISAGWDPGMFSLNRLYANAILPDGKDYTFWGTGVSQGHSDAIRRIEGVLDARQYTVPVAETLEEVRAGSEKNYTKREMHKRICYVVPKENADPDKIAESIVTMPDYFEPYDTEVHFISAEEMREKHSGLPHGGFVIRTGTSGLNGEHRQSIEYSLKLDSNPEFTSLVLVACARAVYRANLRGETGALTMFDIAPRDLIAADREEIIRKML